MVDDVALRLHVLAGVLALAAGPVAMVTRKGGTSHRRCGRLYCGAMAVAGITAMILSYRFGSLLMALLTVFASAHLGKMLGAYVASVTAVSIVQLPQLGELRWVWPSLVGVPAILAVVRADRARGRCAAVGTEIVSSGGRAAAS